jgi:YidC/Oxa1 family membrane protein insertase
MKTDKNTIIGFVLLGILFFVFFWYTNKQQQAIVEQQKREADSMARVKATQIKPIDTVAARLDSVKMDSLSKVTQAGSFQTAALGDEQITTIDNEVMNITFTNKGGQPKSVQLKNFTSYDGKPVALSGGVTDALGYTINTATNQSTETASLFFNAASPVKNADGSQTITYTLEGNNGQTITHQYIVRPKDYMIDWNIRLNGADKLLTQNSLNLHWSVVMKQHQTVAPYEKEQSHLCYYDNDGYDFERAVSGATKEFDQPTQWVTFKQQFFNTTVISKEKFTSGKAEMVLLPDSSRQLYQANAAMKVQLQPSATANIPMQLYYGPNDYHILKRYDNNMENIVDLGSGMFSFVKYINRWIIMPVFDFFATFIKNFGWVIALLTLFIRLVTSPLTYTSYLSGAKMKVLRPELDTLRKKFGDDQQGFAMEQMKLFREAGVNPLGGCIPALLQIPIFFALYSFFSSNILLRGQDFLWARDLSSYDVIAKLPFSIPLGFGDHISLFTLTAVFTSFLISIYNMSMTPDQSNPAIKYMPYIFPFILLFVFNRLPSALTWYYTVSNLITLALQFVIQNYIIDHDKILAQIDLKRKSPKVKSKSKWQERYEQMMETQKKMQEIKHKNQGNKK